MPKDAEKMLEDDYSDVIGKALVGKGLKEADFLEELGISSKAWKSFLAGDFDAELAQQVESALKLKQGALVGHPGYHPKPIKLNGVQRLELPFGQWTVNAWWVELDDATMVFDTGMGSTDLIDAMPKIPKKAFITHGHHDHVGGVEALIVRGVELFGVEFSGSRQLQLGETLQCGGLTIRVIDLSGHYVPAVGYLVKGLERPILVMGDALFAGSMGKTAGPEHYSLALSTLEGAFRDLSEDTVLLPGHGPATTIGEERANNPFLA